MFKDIMVHVDQSSVCPARIKFALELALQHGARLTGLYVYSEPRQKSTNRQAAEVREMFEEHTRGARVATELLVVNTGFQITGVAELIGYYASFTDLLVVNPPLAADRHKTLDTIASPERLLIGTGRPVLMVPRHGHSKKIGERVMVAWKAGPKASRATHDAMPLLRMANYVNFVSVGEATFMSDERERLMQYLALHGVNAKVEMIPKADVSVGDELLNMLAEDQIDLLVLGVHIVARRGRLDMGEIAAYLMDQMTVPMLLSH